eukprot:4357152-Alexandrium_andersonii.AAC.1
MAALPRCGSCCTSPSWLHTGCMLLHRELVPLDAWPCCHDVGRVARVCCDSCTLVACCCIGVLPHAGCAMWVVRA